MKRSLVAAFAFATLVVPAAHAQRHRAVRVVAPACTFSLSVDYPNPVPDTGMTQGRITVTPSSQSCTSWNAFSPVDWISIDGQTDTVLTISVKSNASSTARTAALRIAGLDLFVTQQPHVDQPPLIETGLVKNGTFNTDLTNWGWQDRFPNGVGTVTWSSSDAQNSAGSGSMMLRSTAIPGPGIQSLQCVTGIVSGQVYNYSFYIRLGNVNQGVGVTSVFDLDTDDCSGPYTLRYTQNFNGDGTTWQKVSNSFRVGFSAKSMLIVLASKTKLNTPFDVFYDDIAVKQE